MKQVYSAISAADVSDAATTDQFSMEAPFAGVLRLDECYVRWTEATGTQSSAQGVIAIEVATVEVATLTANISDAIGETQLFTASSDKYVEFSAGDDIVITVKTQASGGTVTGDGDVQLSLEFGV
jgi:hypothetical protein